MSRLIRRGIWLVLLLWCAWPAIVLPQSASANFKIAKDIFDGGGSPSQSANFKLNESLGFPLETGRLASVAFKLEGGFYAVEKLQPALASVSGRVVDYQGQDPVIGAKIIITGVTTTETATDNSGRFTLNTLPVGTPYVLRPKKPGMYFQPPSREYSPLGNDQFNQDFTGSLYGDVSGNDEVRAFDASMVLRYVVRLLNWQNSVRDSIAAEVSGDGSIKSFDASLILRYAAGLITQFPVEGAAAPKLAAAGEPVVLRMEAQPQATKNRLPVTIFIETSEPIYSGDFKLSFDSSLLKLVDISTGEIAGGFLVAHAERQNEMRLALAGAHAVQGHGALLRLEWEVLAEAFDAHLSPITLLEAFLNEGNLSAQIFNAPVALAAAPKNFYLGENYPNPFNPATMIQYQIPTVEASSKKQLHQGLQVRLQVYNLLGEKVRTLVNEFQPPGNYHARWDGADDRGQRLAAGVYLYRFEAGGFVQVKKMLFLP